MHQINSFWIFLGSLMEGSRGATTTVVATLISGVLVASQVP
tara:strand:+ start:882 stop:1004 length:123 start_codon:yes stop_codon:yes gene_type:complete